VLLIGLCNIQSADAPVVMMAGQYRTPPSVSLQREEDGSNAVVAPQKAIAPVGHGWG
jgi:hypothetical protein